MPSSPLPSAVPEGEASPRIATRSPSPISHRSSAAPSPLPSLDKLEVVTVNPHVDASAVRIEPLAQDLNETVDVEDLRSVETSTPTPENQDSVVPIVEHSDTVVPEVDERDKPLPANSTVEADAAIEAQATVVPAEQSLEAAECALEPAAASMSADPPVVLDDAGPAPASDEAREQEAIVKQQEAVSSIVNDHEVRDAPLPSAMLDVEPVAAPHQPEPQAPATTHVPQHATEHQAHNDANVSLQEFLDLEKETAVADEAATEGTDGAAIAGPSPSQTSQPVSGASSPMLSRRESTAPNPDSASIAIPIGSFVLAGDKPGHLRFVGK